MTNYSQSPLVGLWVGAVVGDGDKIDSYTLPIFYWNELPSVEVFISMRLHYALLNFKVLKDLVRRTWHIWLQLRYQPITHHYHSP